jgi:hypothetical protein
LDENNNPIVPAEFIDKANQELQELLELESDIEYKKIPLSWLDGLTFTTK